MASAIPKTKFAKSGDLNIAYQVVGEGPLNLVLVPGWVSHIEYAWEEPSFSRFLKRMASFSRLICLDRRGTGLSDPVSKFPTLEQRMDDVRAVMDAADVERAALFGISEGGPMSVLFAASYPDRISSLVLYGTFARFVRAPDYPYGLTEQQFDHFLDETEKLWGQGVISTSLAPSIAGDEAQIESWGRFERLSVSPGAARTLMGMVRDIDVRDVLPTIGAPTLVLNRDGDRVTRCEAARYMTSLIPGAKYVELPGGDHFPWMGDSNAILDEVEEFLTGVRHEPEPDRRLATVLFTDIVGSTERATELGDRRWREVLESFYEQGRKELVHFRGREIKKTGDGLFASFDGPARAVRCAAAMRDAASGLGIAIRSGIHCGECEIMGEDLGGIAVHIGARVMGKAGPGEVLVSRTVKDLVGGSGLAFADRGVHTLKGIEDSWNLYALDGS